MKELLKQKATQTARRISDHLPQRTKDVFLAASAIGILSAGIACRRDQVEEITPTPITSPSSIERVIVEADKINVGPKTLGTIVDAAIPSVVAQAEATVVARKPATPEPAATARPPRPAEPAKPAPTAAPPSPTAVGFPWSEYKDWIDKKPVVPPEENADGQFARAENLIRLQKILDQQGWEAWARAAGFTFDKLLLNAANMQTLQQTVIGHDGKAVTVTNGALANAEGLEVRWPAVAGMPYNHPVNDPNATCIPGDPNKQSKLCTNTKGLTGTVGLYPDGRDNLEMVNAVNDSKK